MVEDDDVFGASCSNRTVFLNLSVCSSFAVSDLHLPISMSLILFSSSCLSSSPDATARRSAICSSVPGSIGTSPAHLFYSSFFFFLSRSLSRRLLLNMLALSVKGLSIIILIRSRHYLSVVLSLFRAMPELHNPGNLQCDREPRCWPTTRRIFLALPLEFFQL